jgi:membrane fusion protein (multidrug efflux system)
MKIRRIFHQWSRRLVASAVFITAACNSEAPPPPNADLPTLLGPESLSTVVRRELRSGPLLSGSLEASEKAELIAEASGSVLEVPVDLGDTVKRGQLVARIETTGLGANYLSTQSGEAAAQAALELARTNLSRTQELVASGSVPRANLETDQNALRAAEARLAEAHAMKTSAQTRLDATIVRAPLDGVVSAKSVHKGDVVAPGSQLMTIIDPSSMRLEASIASEHLATVKPGVSVEFVVRALGDRTFTGKIERVAPAADPATRRIKLLVSIPNVEGTLLTGLYAEGRVTAERRTAAAVPEAAVEREGQQASLVVIRGGRAERVRVELGTHDEQAGFIEVKSGAAVGERVIVGSARSVKPGTKIHELPGSGASGTQSSAAATPRATLAAAPEVFGR